MSTHAAGHQEAFTEEFMLYGLYVTYGAAPRRSETSPAPLAVRTPRRRPGRSRVLLLASLLVGTVLPNSVIAADATPATAQASDPALLKVLVRKGVLTQAEADQILKEAKSEPTAAPAAPAQAQSAAVSTTPPDDTALHVTYVPEVVRKQLLEKAEADLESKARKEGWLAPNVLPEWVTRLHLYGDIRLRYEGDMFPKGNDNTGAFPNFNAINTGNPYDVSPANPNFAPQLNADQNRNRYRVRGRFGIDADLGEDFVAGLRVATGSDDSPVSENQSFGAAGSGQGGDFAKYSIWLDRAFVRYQPWHDDKAALSLTLGRFANPFFSTNLLWADDLNFDGAVLNGSYRIGSVTPFLTVGAFPVFNTDLNFGSNLPAKYPSHDKWLVAIQGGASVDLHHAWNVKFGAAYYDYSNLAGELSSPCTVLSASDICDTDQTRPTFAQNGNTYMALRNIVPTSANNFGTINQFQYFGLASQFRDLAFTTHIDFERFDPFHLWIDGEYVRNVAFDKSAVSAAAVNNRGAIPTGGTVGPYAGGNTGYFGNLGLGDETLAHRWDWNFNLGYKYVESDAVVDAFTDSDFGLGGTNLKGFIVGANLALASNVWTRVRWMSADTVAGPPYSTDIVQVDLNVKF